jgi:hypothetical protein
MRYVWLTLIVTCVLLMPLVAEAREKPIICYSFDNIKGDEVGDLSGFGNDGTMEGDPEIVDGQFGKGVEFESNRIRTPASESLGADLFRDGSFTLVVWINPKRAGNTWQQIFRAYQAALSNDTLFVNNDGRLSWRGHVGGVWAGGMCETAGGVVAANTWSHVAVVSDTANFRIYVNGELSQESAFQTTDGNNANYYLGGDPGATGESYSGAVDDFAVFDVPLKEADIVTIKNRGVMSGVAVELRGKLATKWASLKSAF